MKYTPSSSQQITIFASKRWSNKTGCLQLFTLTSVAKEKLFTDAKMAIFKTVYTTFVNQLKLPKRGTSVDKNNHTVMLK